MIFWYIFFLIAIPFYFCVDDDFDDAFMSIFATVMVSIIGAFILMLLSFLIVSQGVSRDYVESCETTYITDSVLYYDDDSTITFTYTDENGFKHKIEGHEDYFSIYKSDEEEKVVYTVMSVSPKVNKWYPDWLCDADHWDIYLKDPN